MSVSSTRPTPLGLLVAVQATVSAASLVVEIAAGRMLAPYVGMSLYTWTAVIAVVLAGFSVGHWWGGLLAERRLPRALAVTGRALLAAALTTALAGQALRAAAGPVLEVLTTPVWGITALTCVAFFLPSFFAGVPAPVLTQAALVSGGRTGRALGAMFAAGAIGAIGGTLLAGFVFISWMGSTATLATVTIVYVAAGLLCFHLARQLSVVPIATGVIAVVVAGASLLAPSPCTVESNHFCIAVRDVATDPARPANAMIIDHLVHGISARDAPEVMFTDHAAMLDALARIRAPQPDFSSFHIGGGNYALPRAFATRGLTDITVAEIDPDVTRIAARDFWFDPATARILHQDARTALARDTTRYDIIIGDAFTDTAVPQHLVTQEFFALVRERLAPGGAYLMNVIDYADTLNAVASVAHTLDTVFPHVEIWTEARRPAPGERVVMVIVAGDGPTRGDSFAVPAPERKTFSALGDGFVQGLVARGTLLTDNYAPIDRLVGARD